MSGRLLDNVLYNRIYGKTAWKFGGGQSARRGMIGVTCLGGEGVKYKMIEMMFAAVQDCICGVWFGARKGYVMIDRVIGRMLDIAIDGGGDVRVGRG